MTRKLTVKSSQAVIQHYELREHSGGWKMLLKAPPLGTRNKYMSPVYRVPPNILRLNPLTEWFRAVEQLREIAEMVA